MRCVVLWHCLLIMLANCSTRDSRSLSPEESSASLRVPKQQERTAEACLSHEFKQWFQNLEDVPASGRISKATVKIVSDTSWYSSLGVSKRWVVVNASNEEISFHGGGVNGALIDHVRTQYSHKKWQNLRLPCHDHANSPPIVPGQRVLAGGYAISDVGRLCTDTHSGVTIVNNATKIGEIYHAVGPRASEVTSLADAQDKVKALYHSILRRASSHADHLVLPAISTAIFAVADYTKHSFTRNEFIAAMYEGMYQGIKQYQDESSCSPQSTCSIILNNWDPPI